MGDLEGLDNVGEDAAAELEVASDGGEAACTASNNGEGVGDGGAELTSGLPLASSMRRSDADIAVTLDNV